MAALVDDAVCSRHVTRARKLWTAAAIVAVLAATAYLFVSLTYQLGHGDTWNVGQGAVFEENSRDVAIHPLRVGYEVQIAITVRNPGPLAVALDEVSFSGADIVIDEVTMIERAGQGPHRCCLAEDAEPFHPVKIGSGDQAMVWLELRVTAANPYPPCAGFTLESANIRYHVMGVARSQRLPLRTKIEFRIACN